MQVDSSLTFVSQKNKRVWAGKHRELARREEVLYNIALQSGIPPLLRSNFTPIIKVYTDCIGIAGSFVGVFVMILAIRWSVSAGRDFWRDTDTLSMMGFAFIVSLLGLLFTFSYSRRYRDLLSYPPCMIRLYRELVASRKITVCEVDEVEMLGDSTYLIRYQFALSKSEKSIKGQYITNRLVQPGMKMAVIYLDATCHVLL